MGIASFSRRHPGKDTQAAAILSYKVWTGFPIDLDGTLVDSVYQHVLAWRESTGKARHRSWQVWRIHRRIGMSGGLLVNALLREIGRRVTKAEAERSARFHGEAYARLVPQVRVLPGARELLEFVNAHVPGPSPPAAASKAPAHARSASARPEVSLITRDTCRTRKTGS